MVEIVDTPFLLTDVAGLYMPDGIWFVSHLAEIAEKMGINY
jgi:hypothetical protein